MNQQRNKKRMANLVSIYNKMKHDISMLEKDGIRASFQVQPIITSLDKIAKTNNGEQEDINLFRRGIDLLRNKIDEVKKEYKSSVIVLYEPVYEDEFDE